MNDVLVTVDVKATTEGKMYVEIVNHGEIVESGLNYHVLDSGVLFSRDGIHHVDIWDTSKFTQLKAHCFKYELDEWKEKLKQLLKERLENKFTVAKGKLSAFDKEEKECV